MDADYINKQTKNLKITKKKQESTQTGRDDLGSGSNLIYKYKKNIQKLQNTLVYIIAYKKKFTNP